MNKEFFQSGLACADKFNKAEFASTTRGFINLVKAVGMEVLHAPAVKFAEIEEKYLLLQEMVGITRATKDTLEIASIVTEIDKILKYIRSVIQTAKELPNAAKKDAALSLSYCILAYQKVSRLPLRQKEQNIIGMLADLVKPEAAEYMETLGLQGELELLTLKMAQLSVLLNKRANFQTSVHEEKAKKLRQEISLLYVEITKVIWAYSIVEPSAEATEFIKNINKLFYDAEVSYNQRMAQKKKEEPTEPSDPTEPQEPSQPPVEDEVNEEEQEQ